MLVLTRQLGERIVCGEGDNKVTIEVVEIQRGRVRLGITADKGHVPVRRSELPELKESK